MPIIRNIKNEVGAEVRQRLNDITDIKAESSQAVKVSEEANIKSQAADGRSEYQKERLDMLIANGEQPSEVVDLRKDTDGVEHATAGERVASDYTKVSSQLTNTDQKVTGLNRMLNGSDNKKIMSASFYFWNNLTINDNVLNKTYTLDRLKELGFTHITLCILLQCRDTSTFNSWGYDYTLDKFKEMVRFIQDYGFKIIVKFHPNDSGGNSIYKNNNFPSDPTAMFSTLQKCIVDTIKGNDVEIVCLANESPNITENYRDQWFQLINAVRTSNPEIKVTNSPTFWDVEHDTCVFWDLCDYIGGNIYPKSTDEPVASINTITKSMYQSFDNQYHYFFKFLELSKKYNKPYLITEVGILPYESQTFDPASWSPLSNVYNEDVQYNFYKSFLNTYMNADSCAGILIWSVTDPNFNFIGRKGETAIEEFNGGNTV
ncbi:glycoside hydrolase family 113 [Terribacillus saccharophilus]|uniref:Glycoside hydrolase family 5 domain-containing protein n=1 Tax=Terribacillus saccharophilus TaxID=361277 RepID=A0ABX4H085_9BACI|nr:cellulase family glycosylhydrolase [Terribacillus saccharophilus]PAD35984.1 hypothetical protein CHH56_06035 [Terribacillus saccharophilus]PAD96966.1 hypothetical protein CHH50_06275 [Terribacillus saccharophilus]PAE00542.1 hypothetical protein CHH48_07180 [Terribacillus saccharophilus]